jgi:hypothetical protein
MLPNDHLRPDGVHGLGIILSVDGLLTPSALSAISNKATRKNMCTPHVPPFAFGKKETIQSSPPPLT